MTDPDPRQHHANQSEEAPVVGPSVNVAATGSTAVPVQVGENNRQYNSFTIHRGEDRTIVLELVSERDGLELRPGQEAALGVLITNSGVRTVELSLSVVGALSSVSVLEPAVAQVAAGTGPVRCRLSLRCDPTTPEASRYQMQVEARAQVDDGGEPMTWRSRSVPVTIAPRPAVDVCAGAAVRQGRSQVYRVEVVVSNIGNTPVVGRLIAAEQASIGPVAAARRPQVAFTSPVRAGSAGRFGLAPAQHASLPISITLPRGGLRRRDWRVPLQVVADGERLSPEAHWVAVSDPGALSDTAARSRELLMSTRALFSRLAPPIRSWASAPSTLARGTLLAGFVVAVLVAAFGGLVVGGSGHVGPTPSQTSVAEPASTVTSASHTASSLAPVTNNAASGAATASFKQMPCTPGTWIVFLGAVNGADAEVETAAMAVRERQRAAAIGELALGTRISASSWDQSCPTLRGGPVPGDEEKQHWYVWIGPVQSQDEGLQICTDLGKPLEWDCLVRRVSA